MKRSDLDLISLDDLEPGDHLCCIYETEAEHRAVVTPFLRQGLEQDEKVLYIVDARTAQNVLDYLRADGVDVEPYLSRGQLIILSQDESYTKGGEFDPDRMLALLRAETEQALAEGYSALRVTGEMSWALRGLPGSERLIEYEAKLNTFIPINQCLAICQYDRRRFEAETLLDVLRTHPVAVIGTEIYQNFYYVPPGELLGSEPSDAEFERWVDHLASQKTLEMALQRERDRAQAYLDAAGVIVVAIDHHGNVTQINQRGCEILGYTREEIIGSDWITNFVPERKREEVEDVLKALLLDERGTESQSEGLILTRTGEERVILWHDVVLRDEMGNVTGTLGSGTDVTDRVRAREKIQFQARLLDTVGQAVLATEPDGTIIYWNHAAEEIYGWAEEEVLGRNVMDVTPTEASQERAAEIMAHLQNGKRWKGEFSVKRQDGTTFPAIVSSTPFQDEDGNMIAIIGVTTDISQRKKMEEAQQWEAAVNASMAEISQALLTMESTEEISQLVLDHAQQLTGSTFGYVGHIDPETDHLICTTMTHEIWDVCEVEDKDIIFEEFGGLWGWVLDHREPLMTNQPSEDQRSSGTPEGHISINRFVSAPAMIGDELVGQIALANPGRPYEERDLRLTERLANVYALAVQHARTERRLEAYSEQLEEMVKERTQELREAQERLLRRKKLAMLGQLAGSVSHELRGPLGSIKNSAYFLQLALEDPAPDVQETLDILNEEIARSETIIDSMLDFARTETPNRQPVSANVLVENALNRVKVPDTIDVELNLEDTLPTVAADPKQLLGVFENITKNAVEAMPEGGKLRVKSNTVRDANEEPVQVEIAFADNGVGITEKDLERVFEPLFSTKEGGTGLGLPLAQALVEAHGGSITVKSRVGEGSTFTVLLPVERKGI